MNGLLDAEQVADLALRLREHGFGTGLSECLAAERLMVRLAENGAEFSSPAGLKTWLSPIFCGTPAEQERFSDLYDGWVVQRSAEQPGVSAPLPLESPKPTPYVRARRMEPWQILAAALAFALVAGGVLAAVHYIASQEPRHTSGRVTADGALAPFARVFFGEQVITADDRGAFEIGYRNADLPATLIAVWGGRSGSASFAIPVKDPLEIRIDPPQPRTAPGPVRNAAPIQPVFPRVEPPQEADWRIIAALSSAPLVILAGWLVWMHLARLRLIRWNRRGIAELHRIPVKGAAAALLKSISARFPIQELKKHRPVTSQDIDLRRTIERTARSLGVTRFVYAPRKVMPEYLALIDTARYSDQHAELVNAFVQKLREELAFVERYWYAGDPRVCFATKGGRGTAALTDLAARYSGYSLLLFTDVSGLRNSVTGDLLPYVDLLDMWPQRCVVLSAGGGPVNTPVQERLRDLGFVVVPYTADGLTAAARHWQAGEGEDVPVVPEREDFPALLNIEPERWLERSDPAPGETGALLAQLRRYLTPDGLHWMAACAVYPQLNWNLTLFLGECLGAAARPELLDRLVSLPWFRDGFMPHWLRKALVVALPDDVRVKIRSALESLLLTALESPKDGFEIEVAAKRARSRESWWSRRALLNLLRTERSGTPLSDVVLLSVLSGHEGKLLALRTPGGFAQFVRRFSNPRRPVLPFMIAIGSSVAIGASAVAFYPAPAARTVGFEVASPGVPDSGLVKSQTPGFVPVVPAAPSPQVNLPIPPAPYTIGGQQFDDVYFDYDRSDIRRDALATLTRVAASIKAALRANPNFTLIIEGHNDERGSAEFKLGAGDRRATAVKDFLVQLGVPADRLKTISYGKERPQCPEATEECWQKNRRVHFATSR
jgi:outer membrane protein OmpA-like peptidoglycan-associated protein